MRALFVTSHLRVGGAQRQWSILIPELARSGFDVTVLALEEEGEFFAHLVSKGIEARCARMRRRSDLAGMRRAFSIARKVAPDLVVTQGVRAQVLGQIMAWGARIPHVATDHRGPGLPFKPHREVLLRIVAPHVDRVVAVTARQIPQLVRRRYRRDRIRVIPNGISRELLAPLRTQSDVRQALELPPDAFVAVLVAVLRPEKRADAFVRAVALAAQKDPRIRGLVVGSGPELDLVQQLGEASGGVIRVLGQRADIGDLLAAADVACLTSTAEAASMSALESMAAGLPVVATDVGGMSELVTEGVTGYLVQEGDEVALAERLVALAADSRLGERLGAAARNQQEERFGLAAMVDGYSKLFQEAAAA